MVHNLMKCSVKTGFSSQTSLVNVRSNTLEHVYTVRTITIKKPAFLKEPFQIT